MFTEEAFQDFWLNFHSRKMLVSFFYLYFFFLYNEYIL